MSVEFVPALDPASIAELREHLARTRWPEAETTGDDSQGVRLEIMQGLVDRWAHHYDWDRYLARITTFPQMMSHIDGLDIHAIHAPSSRRDATPLLLTHGWPSTCFEFLDVISLLTEPEHGPAFHVVCPSLPGYAFSGRSAGSGWGADRIADAWAELMDRLGYPRFVAHGGDWGAIVSTKLALRHPNRVLGLHLTMPLAAASPGDLDGATVAELRGADREQRYRRGDFAYALVQHTRPQTIGYALVDSPVALCAWIVEKLIAWSGRDAEGNPLLSDDAMLDIVSTYWLTRTGASAARLYSESLRMDLETPVDIPTACSIFPDEIIRPPRAAVERRYRDLRSWRERPTGGHFPAAEIPTDLAHEIHLAAQTFD